MASQTEIYAMELEAQNAELRTQLNDRSEWEATQERHEQERQALWDDSKRRQEHDHAENVAAQDRTNRTLERIADALEAAFRRRVN